jgi:hypothetical protein
MATSVTFGGTGGSGNSSYKLTSGPIGLPSGGRAMANGDTRCGFRLKSLHLGGYSGAASGTASLAGSAGSWSTPSGSPAYRAVSGSLALVNGGSKYLTVTPGARTRFGRGGSGTVTDGFGVDFTGTIGGTYEWSEAPTAPTLSSVAMAGPTSAVVNFAAPSDDGGEAVTGYRIVYANNSGFVGAATLDVDATALSRVVTGLTPGEWWFKVAARNAVTQAAASSSVFSSSLSVVLSADVGDLDGWAAFGTLPAGLTPLVGAGLRRGLVYPIGAGAPTGLLREISCASSGSVAAAALGIERTFTGLVVGRTYKLNGTALSLQDTTPAGNLYRFAVVGIGSGSNATTSDTADPVAIPEYTFVATGTSHVVRVELNEAASWSGSGWFEAVAFYGVTLTEIPNASPYRLQDVTLESSLANHFTIACDTVGAVWWVDSDDVTQFRQVPGDTAVRATFTDARAPGELEYIDLAESYDTRNVVNDLAVKNYGRDAVTGNSRDVDYALTDAASVAEWGVRSGDVAMCLRSGYVLLENMVKNPSGEVDAAFWAGGTGISAVARVNTVGGAVGSWAIRGTTSGATANLIAGSAGVFYPVAPGETYTFSLWVRSQVARSATLNIQWWDVLSGGGSVIATATSASFSTSASGWVRVHLTAVAPVGAVGAYPYISTTGNSAGQYHYADGAMFHAGALIGYFDGSTTPTDDLIYEWTGAAGASSSVVRTFETLNDRIAEIVEQLKTPQRAVSSITWNAQEDPALAAALDIQDRIRVRFQGATADYRIVGISHRVTGTRWLMTLTLAPR